MSSIKLEYFSNVIDGKLQKNVSDLIAKELPYFNGKRIRIKFEKLQSKRSTQQNRLWWLYITIVAKEIGYEPDELHEICKFKFLKKERVDEATGEIFQYVGSTAKLNKTEFSDLIFDFRKWVVETFSINLPDPGESFEMQIE